ncbi:hypothetical protein [Polaromonas sp.]|uniref:hypothetical protein n=1 Tax=Polaromonas sp. TaxID=1869339 RepID=UPI0032645F1D
MGRLIGTRIKQAVELVELNPGCTSKDVAQGMSGVSHANASKCCRLAQGYGLLTSDTSTSPMKYTVVEGWRNTVSGVVAREPNPDVGLNAETTVQRAIANQPTSVFHLGALALRAQAAMNSGASLGT